MTSATQASSAELRLLVLTPSTASFSSRNTPKAVYGTKSVFSTFLNHLTGTSPSEDIDNFAGYTTHTPLQFRNRYYNADVTLWCDELPCERDDQDSPTRTLSEWLESMRSDKAKEVRQVIGGFVLILPLFEVTTRDSDAQISEVAISCIQAVHQLRELIEDDFGRDVAAVIVIQDMLPSAQRPPSDANTPTITLAHQLEDACIEEHGIFGWDIVPWLPQDGQNSSLASMDTDSGYEIPEVNGREEKIGIARVLEVLEQTNWSASVVDDELPDNLSETSDILAASTGFNAMASSTTKTIALSGADELQNEMLGLHFALEDQSSQQTEGDGEDTSIQQLAGLMDRVVATKEAAAELPEAERKQFAKREISKIMRDMNIN